VNALVRIDGKFAGVRKPDSAAGLQPFSKEIARQPFP
jgi:hypothetical protein